MVDPLSALGLVSNIAQLMGFSASVISETNRFLRSSHNALPSNAALLELTEWSGDLFDEIKSFNQERQPLTKSEAAAYDAAARCLTEADLLLAELEDLNVGPSTRKVNRAFKAVGQSIRTMSKRDKLKERKRRLTDLEANLQTALLQLIWRSQYDGFTELRGWLQTNSCDAVHSAALKNMADRIMDALPSADERQARMILDSLAYPDQFSRKDGIVDAHDQTFEWCFDAGQTPFFSWLNRGDGIFWISGKAGSGKSTLIKFLSSDVRTGQALYQWTNRTSRKHLIVSEHYFWYAGSPIQKSYNGLLRSVLYDILSYDMRMSKMTPNWDYRLTSSLCPRRWHGTREEASSNVWQRAELMQSLWAIKDIPQVKLFLLIDGLDEYHPQSDHGYLINHLKSLAKLPNVKLCVSSRPWNDFERAFGRKATKLQVEQYTREDIARYARDELNQCIERLRVDDDELIATIPANWDPSKYNIERLVAVIV